MFNHFTKLCVRTSLIVAMMATAAWEQETALPRKDIAGASDSPALKRYEGSLILTISTRSLPTSPFRCLRWSTRARRPNRAIWRYSSPSRSRRSKAN